MYIYIYIYIYIKFLWLSSYKRRKSSTSFSHEALFRTIFESFTSLIFQGLVSNQ